MFSEGAETAHNIPYKSLNIYILNQLNVNI